MVAPHQIRRPGCGFAVAGDVVGRPSPSSSLTKRLMNSASAPLDGQTHLVWTASGSVARWPSHLRSRRSERGAAALAAGGRSFRRGRDRLAHSSATIASSTPSIDGVLIVSPLKFPRSIALRGQSENFGRGRSGRNFEPPTHGAQDQHAWPPSLPRPFATEGRDIDFAQFASGKRTPRWWRGERQAVAGRGNPVGVGNAHAVVVPFQVNRTSFDHRVARGRKGPYRRDNGRSSSLLDSVGQPAFAKTSTPASSRCARRASSTCHFDRAVSDPGRCRCGGVGKLEHVAHQSMHSFTLLQARCDASGQARECSSCEGSSPRAWRRGRTKQCGRAAGALSGLRAQRTGVV